MTLTVVKRLFREILNARGPVKIIKYEDMLYPQHRYLFSKTIDKDTADWLQVEARKRLDENPDAPEETKRHWRKLGDGTLPFGYKLKDDI